MYFPRQLGIPSKLYLSEWNRLHQNDLDQLLDTLVALLYDWPWRLTVFIRRSELKDLSLWLVSRNASHFGSPSRHQGWERARYKGLEAYCIYVDTTNRPLYVWFCFGPTKNLRDPGERPQFRQARPAFQNNFPKTFRNILNHSAMLQFSPKHSENVTKLSANVAKTFRTISEDALQRASGKRMASHFIESILRRHDY